MVLLLLMCSQAGLSRGWKVLSILAATWSPSNQRKPQNIRRESTRRSSSKWRLFTSYCKLLCDCFKYLLKRSRPFLTTPNVKNKLWSLYETLGSTGEMKLMIKFCLILYNSSELLIFFLDFPRESVFDVISSNYLYLSKRTEI